MFQSCAVGRSENGSEKTSYAYASPSFQGQRKYSFIAVSGSSVRRRVIWYAQAKAFVQFQVADPMSGSEFLLFHTVYIRSFFLLTYKLNVGKHVHQVAYVKYLLSTGQKDATTQCETFTWEKAVNLFACIDISNIIKIVPIVPGFKRDTSVVDGLFYKNELLFRD